MEALPCLQRPQRKRRVEDGRQNNMCFVAGADGNVLVGVVDIAEEFEQIIRAFDFYYYCHHIYDHGLAFVLAFVLSLFP